MGLKKPRIANLVFLFIIVISFKYGIDYAHKQPKLHQIQSVEEKNETFPRLSRKEKLQFPELKRENDLSFQESFDIFEVQNQTKLQEEITRRRKNFQTRIKGYPVILEKPIGVDQKIQRPVATNDFELIPKKIRTISPKVKATVNKTNFEQTKVLLITAHRSGSTFLGELFNQNENAFYLFEPLAAIQSEMSTMGCDKMSNAKIQLIENGFECNLPWFYQNASSEVATLDKKYRSGQLYASKLPPNAIEEVTPTRGKCAFRKMCFRENLRWSCDAGICNKRTVDQKIEDLTGQIGNKETCLKCLPVNEKVASQICKTKSIIAQKLIRFCNLDDVKIINESHANEVKTIVLFRDPRGMFSSRKRMLGAEFGAQFGIDAAQKSISKTCHHFVESFKYLDNTNFLFLRYEDMSMDPITTAIKVYDFISQPLPMKLFQWIRDSANVKVSEQGRGYGTVKNSKQTMNAWRQKITFDEVKFVQEEPKCKEFMSKMGYLRVPDTGSLKSDDFKLFTDWKK